MNTPEQRIFANPSGVMVHRLTGGCNPLGIEFERLTALDQGLTGYHRMTVRPQVHTRQTMSM